MKKALFIKNEIKLDGKCKSTIFTNFKYKVLKNFIDIFLFDLKYKKMLQIYLRKLRNQYSVNLKHMNDT